MRRIGAICCVACSQPSKARTIPASVLRSVTPIASYPSAAACAANSCGRDPPCRKEKLVVTWSSMGRKVMKDLRTLFFRHGKAWPCHPRVSLGETALGQANSWIPRPSLGMTERRGPPFQASPEHPMHEPARGRRGPVQPGAVEPEAAAFGVFHAVMVADLGILLARQPPLRRDALGAFGGTHLVQHMTPAELHRRIVRYRRDGVDRLGMGEQADRPLRCLRPMQARAFG